MCTEEGAVKKNVGTWGYTIFDFSWCTLSFVLCTFVTVTLGAWEYQSKTKT